MGKYSVSQNRPIVTVASSDSKSVRFFDFTELVSDLASNVQACSD